MIFVRRLTRLEYAKLHRMTRQEVGRVSQRAHMILLSAQQRSVAEIADLFDVSRTTVRFWIERFEAAGTAGLYDEPRSGRPRKAGPVLDQAVLDELRHDIEQNAAYLTTFALFEKRS
jgi:transposase